METPLETTPAPYEPALPPPIPGPPRPRWHPLVRAALFLVAFIAAQAVLGVLFGALSFAFDKRFLQSPEGFLIGVVLQAPLVIGLTWLFVRFLDRRTLAKVGARWPEGGRGMALRQLVTMPLGVLALIGTWVLLLLVLPDALGSIRIGGLSAAYLAGGPAWWPLPPAFLLGFLLALFLIQGGIEEWVVRGYIYHALKERWRPWWAALASSVLFSLLHAANPNVSAAALVNIILAGLVLAALVERSGSLWSATLAHGVWNFAIACLLSVPVSGFRLFHLLDVSIAGNEVLTGGSFGPEGSLLLTFLGVPLTLALWWPVLKRHRHPGEIVASALEDIPGSAPL